MSRTGQLFPDFAEASHYARQISERGVHATIVRDESGYLVTSTDDPRATSGDIDEIGKSAQQFRFEEARLLATDEAYARCEAGRTSIPRPQSQETNLTQLETDSARVDAFWHAERRRLALLSELESLCDFAESESERSELKGCIALMSKYVTITPSKRSAEAWREVVDCICHFMRLPDPKSRCPSCGACEGVPVIYGFPGNLLFFASSERRVRLGGCMMPQEHTGREMACLGCGAEWIEGDTANQE
jgi:hypothetical protein